MAQPYEEYTKGLYKKHGYFGTWLPGVPLRLGDVGILQDGYWFKGVTTLQHRGIQFTSRVDSAEDNVDYTSSKGVEITFKAQGQAPISGSHLTQANAGITIEFSKKNATVFRLQECLFHTIEDQVAVKEAILAKWHEGRWNDQWVVITQLCTAEAATILMSKSRSGKIELTAGAKVKSPTDSDLANVDAELKIAYQSSMETSIVAANGLTPLFQASGLIDEREKAVAARDTLGALELLTPADVLEHSDLAETISFGKIEPPDSAEEEEASEGTVKSGEPALTR